MTKRAAILLSLLLLLALLMTLKSITRISRGDEADSAGGLETRRKNADGESRESNTEKFQTTKRERSDANDVTERRDLEREFSRIFPQRFSSNSTTLCDASLKPGETLVIDGFKNAGGDYNFTTMQVEAVEGEAGQSFVIKTKVLSLSPEKSAEIGLGSLLSPAHTKIQKSVVLPPGETAWMKSAVRISSLPGLTTPSETAASMTFNTENQLHIIDLIASPGSDGESIRLRIKDQGLTKEK